ncbi:hypothetical protein [Nocardioides iriomotensis]|uniref:DUF2142 domain-containing protein n=1 Tax=Nocardioides iriomotensis TaxID=715784 RepID=A0A4Q5IWT1_9ACTN|nr:hypothetical protein [Nocardioides iriomotensis]RYU09648.1 hypothetical protein ETU37_21705 [Nocardioides iriomotensis]
MAALFALFLLAFRWGLHFRLVDAVLGTDGTGFVSSFQLDSDGLVFRRLEQNRLTGLLSGEMALRMDPAYAQPYGPFYASQFGLGGWLLTLLPTALGLYGTAGISLMLTLVAAGNAAIATLAVVASRRVMSMGAAVLCALALLQPWPVAMAHSAYWMIGLKVLPAAALAILYARGRATRPRVFVTVAVVSTFTFLSGYEFATVVVATALGVATYICLVERRGVTASLMEIANVLGACLSGFVGAIVIHLVQLSVRLGGMTVALEAFEETVSKRTGATSLELDPAYLESLAVSPSQVLATYLGVPVIGSPLALPIVSSFSVAALIAVCIVVVVTDAPRSVHGGLDLRQHAMGIAWFVTLLGPLGWFLLARPHSYIHTHINPALWFLPVVPLGLALLWRPLRIGTISLRSHPVALVALAAVMTCIVLFYGYSLSTVK